MRFRARDQKMPFSPAVSCARFLIALGRARPSADRDIFSRLATARTLDAPFALLRGLGGFFSGDWAPCARTISTAVRLSAEDWPRAGAPPRASSRLVCSAQLTAASVSAEDRAVVPCRTAAIFGWSMTACRVAACASALPAPKICCTAGLTRRDFALRMATLLRCLPPGPYAKGSAPGGIGVAGASLAAAAAAVRFK